MVPADRQAGNPSLELGQNAPVDEAEYVPERDRDWLMVGEEPYWWVGRCAFKLYGRVEAEIHVRLFDAARKRRDFEPQDCCVRFQKAVPELICDDRVALNPVRDVDRLRRGRGNRKAAVLRRSGTGRQVPRVGGGRVGRASVRGTAEAARCV
jgi:hypothetical protein